uniref:Uncharacterized protein n=1 Tax=Romanomermis culicivorax TaxID=13658 RepID=A0A915KUL2_ROMCU
MQQQLDEVGQQVEQQPLALDRLRLQQNQTLFTIPGIKIGTPIRSLPWHNNGTRGSANNNFTSHHQNPVNSIISYWEPQDSPKMVMDDKELVKEMSVSPSECQLAAVAHQWRGQQLINISENLFATNNSLHVTYKYCCILLRQDEDTVAANNLGQEISTHHENSSQKAKSPPYPMAPSKLDTKPSILD